MVVLLGLLPDRWALLAVFLQPMLTACFFPAGFTVLSRIVPPRARNLSVALTMFVGYLIGGGLVPTILGIFGDANRFGLAFVLVGSLIFLGAFLMLRMDLRDAEEEGSR
jgi:NNP family nitrate/nitrite transporter-like MFS transporter